MFLNDVRLRLHYIVPLTLYASCILQRREQEKKLFPFIGNHVYHSSAVKREKYFSNQIECRIPISSTSFNQLTNGRGEIFLVVYIDMCSCGFVRRTASRTEELHSTGCWKLIKLWTHALSLFSLPRSSDSDRAHIVRPSVRSSSVSGRAGRRARSGWVVV